MQDPKKKQIAKIGRKFYIVEFVDYKRVGWVEVLSLCIQKWDTITKIYFGYFRYLFFDSMTNFLQNILSKTYPVLVTA